MNNIKEAKRKNLIVNDDVTLYQKLQKDYKYLLEYYINTLIDLKSFEDKIDNSNLFIGKNTKYKKLNEYLDLNYFFLINNIFIEKLDESDIKLLKENFNKENISNELINMVKKTYKEVIKDNYFRDEYSSNIYKVCYGPVVPINFVDNDSLVFRLIYGKNLKEELDTNKFIELHKKQLSFLENIKKELIDDLKKLDIKCEVLLEKVL